MSSMVHEGDTCFYYSKAGSLFGCMSSDMSDRSSNEAAVKAANFMGYLINMANSSFVTANKWVFFKKGDPCGALNTNLTRSAISSWEKVYMENLPSPSGSYTMNYLYAAIGGVALLTVLAVAATVVIRRRRSAQILDMKDAGALLESSIGDEVSDINPNDSAVLGAS